MNNMFNGIFVGCFGEIEDSRYKNKQHKLIDVIAITICGVLAGLDNFVDIAEFAVGQEAWFRKHLTLENGIPSHDTLNRMMGLIEPKEFSRCFLNWLKAIKLLLNKETVIPIDGKTLCGSHDKSNGKKAIHIVNAYSCANGIAIGQVAVDEKSNEITAIPKLLRMLSIKGAIITNDAMGTQREIAKQIIEQEADYILAVKNNQKELFESIVDVFSLSDNTKFNQELAKNIFEHEIVGDHGRIEERTVYSLSAKEIATQTNLKNWEGIQSIIKVTSINHVNNASQTRFFISSINQVEVKKIAEAIRAHWSIENNLHWVLDVVFNEDASRIRDQNTAENMSSMRKMGAFLLKQDTTKGSMKTKMLRNCINPDNITKLFERI